MSIGRPAIIVGQAIVVGVLIVVVYLTLLQPEEESPLSRVDAPTGTQITQRPVNPSDRDREGGVGERAGDEGGGERAGDGGGGSASGAGGAGGSAGGASGAGDLVTAAIVPGTAGAAGEGAPVAPVAPPTDSEAEPESPAADQYNNAVSRLTEHLR